MKKVVSFVLMACMAVMLFAACGQAASSSQAANSSQPAGSETVSGDAIVIGGLAPLTGGVSQYGIASSNGSKLAVEEINAAGGILGRQIEFVLLDEKGDATEAINAYNRLVQQDGIVALVGDITTKPTIAVAQSAAEDGIPMITPTATGAEVTQAGENIFRVCFTDPYQGELMAHYAAEKLGAKTVAVLYDTGDDYSQGVADTFEATAEELGLTVTAKEGYQTGATDFNAQLTKIKQDNPDVIMAPCYYEDAAKILTQARALGIDTPFLGPDGWDGVLTQLKDAGADTSVLNNSFYSSQYSSANASPELEAFLNTYKETYGDEANMFSVLGYEAMHAMAAAIEAAGSTDSAAIVEALKNLEVQGLTGTISYKGGNDPVRNAYIIEFKDGEEEVLGTYTF
ncbi:MAG: ABC transporter substrate-binding protein [Oscillospiraceae bacterium]